ncbi:DnaB-like helicase C-terminal domain-containing protein [Marinifilum sp. D737]|uniref:DnaB-like helicase C-terminal domain-containing protein n=1 Tax=Marinifilum sp. D737 TaxID=2969628 RepID=UPI0022756CE3|nr:DnaB-like helicase C-terminal domain-containing protein [Marinifilum sp. D737]MCY1636594.1 toprim domain-containing protein [Marinifilum sp. D737]
MKIQYQNYIMEISNIRGIQGKTTCPRCKELGKQHWKDKCLSINLSKQVFHCHKCGFKGYFGELEERKTNQTSISPFEKGSELKAEHIEFFNRRKISLPVIQRNLIKAYNGYIIFRYNEGSALVNQKFRSISEKKFFQSKNCKATVFKYDDIKDQKNIIVCEGELDALSWEEAGFKFATSVNQGAPNVNDKHIDAKLECIKNCFDIFEQAETIYLSMDQDPNGLRLQKELIKMFTPEKCKIINYNGCKDANELLIKGGVKALQSAFQNAYDVKVEGIFRCSDVLDEVMHHYKNSQPRGTTTYFKNIDECWTWRLGELNLWTGYNNEGKSQMLKQLLLLKSLGDNWKHAVFSPEETPHSEWFTDLIESLVGKSADSFHKDTDNYMNEEQLKMAARIIEKSIFNVFPANDHSLDKLLNLFSYLVRKHNIQTITIDPYNQIHHKMGRNGREDLYISQFMAKLKKFAVDHNVAVNLIAHQVTPQVQKGVNYPPPNLYSIKGGGTFADKADNVLAIWRPNRNTIPTDTLVKFMSQKIKKQKLTGIPGSTDLYFERKTNRYNNNDGSPFEEILKNPEQKSITNF